MLAMVPGAVPLLTVALSVVWPDVGLVVGVEYAPGRQTLSPASPTCSLLVAGRFSPLDFAFASSKFDLAADTGVFSDPEVLLTTGANPGIIAGSRITGIVVGQIHLPPLFEANPANPIAVYRVSYTATEFTPGRVLIQAATRRFDVYPSAMSSVSESRLERVTEPQAAIRIVPAASPSGLAIVALGVIGLPRRRGRV